MGLVSSTILMQPVKDAKPSWLKCPKCQDELVLCGLSKYMTMMNIPVSEELSCESEYYCKMCDLSYKKTDEESLRNSGKEFEVEIKKHYVRALVAWMTYMARADWTICSEELKELKRVAALYPDHKSIIKETIDVVVYSKWNALVFGLLKKATEHLAMHRKLQFFEEIIKIQFADDVVDDEEKALVSAILTVCKIPESFLDPIISKITGE